MSPGWECLIYLESRRSRRCLSLIRCSRRDLSGIPFGPLARHMGLLGVAGATQRVSLFPHQKWGRFHGTRTSGSVAGKGAPAVRRA
jgi:hypothetical protein